MAIEFKKVISDAVTYANVSLSTREGLLKTASALIPVIKLTNEGLKHAIGYDFAAAAKVAEMMTDGMKVIGATLITGNFNNIINRYKTVTENGWTIGKEVSNFVDNATRTIKGAEFLGFFALPSIVTQPVMHVPLLQLIQNVAGCATAVFSLKLTCDKISHNKEKLGNWRTMAAADAQKYYQDKLRVFDGVDESALTSSGKRSKEKWEKYATKGLSASHVTNKVAKYERLNTRNIIGIVADVSKIAILVFGTAAAMLLVTSTFGVGLALLATALVAGATTQVKYVVNVEEGSRIFGLNIPQMG
jgi:hypothetical protein